MQKVQKRTPRNMKGIRGYCTNMYNAISTYL
jgi:hypothetical protein